MRDATIERRNAAGTFSDCFADSSSTYFLIAYVYHLNNSKHDSGIVIASKPPFANLAAV